MIGRVKWIHSHREHGLILLMDGREVYFHTTQLAYNQGVGSLYPGCQVSFDLITTQLGLEASNVRAMERA